MTKTSSCQSRSRVGWHITLREGGGLEALATKLLYTCGSLSEVRHKATANENGELPAAPNLA